MINRFSRWVEATPSADQSASTVIQILTREVIPRFVLTTTCITSMDCENCTIASEDKQRPGCVCHLQSYKIVERANGTLKAKLNKICPNTKLNWIYALMLALITYCMQTNRIIHLWNAKRSTYAYASLERFLWRATTRAYANGIKSIYAATNCYTWSHLFTGTQERKQNLPI